MNTLTTALLNMFAIGLGLNAKEAAYLSGLNTGHDNQLRLLHYPSAETSQGTTKLRMFSHTDYGFVHRPVY